LTTCNAYGTGESQARSTATTGGNPASHSNRNRNRRNPKEENRIGTMEYRKAEKGLFTKMASLFLRPLFHSIPFLSYQIQKPKGEKPHGKNEIRKNRGVRGTNHQYQKTATKGAAKVQQGRTDGED